MVELYPQERNLPQWAPRVNAAIDAVRADLRQNWGHNLAHHGGVGDDATDNSAALAAAVAAAEDGLDEWGGGYVIVPPGVYRVAAGIQLRRSTRLELHPGAALRYTARGGSLLTFHSPSDGNWVPGGVTGGRLIGSGGSAVGVTIGAGTARGQGVVLEGVEIDGFDRGVVLANAAGETFLVQLNGCSIHNNVGEGVVLETALAENIQLNHTNVFNNGQGTGRAGILLAAGCGADMHITGGSIDDNGNGSIGQIYAPPTANLTLLCTGVHFERPSSTGGLPHVDSAGSQANGGSGVISLVNCFLLASAGVTQTAPQVRIRSGVLQILGGVLGCGPTTAALVQAGTADNESVRFTVLGAMFYCDGPSSRYLSSPSTNTQFLWLGNATSGAGLTPVADFGGAAGNVGLHDQTTGVGPTGTLDLLRVAASYIGGAATLRAHLTGTATWDPPNLSNNAETATTLTVTGAALGDVVALSFTHNLQGMALHGHVSAADTVTAVLRNGTGGAIDLASGTLRAVVWKY